MTFDDTKEGDASEEEKKQPPPNEPTQYADNSGGAEPAEAMKPLLEDMISSFPVTKLASLTSKISNTRWVVPGKIC